MATVTVLWASVTDPRSPTGAQATFTVNYDSTDLSLISGVLNNTACVSSVLAWIFDTVTHQNAATTIAGGGSHTWNVPTHRYFLVNDPVMGLSAGPTIQLGLGF